MAIVSVTAGSAYKLNHNSSVHLARVKGGSIRSSFKGYKIGYIYNSKGYNKEGWETTVELISIINTQNNDYYIYDKSKKIIIPSISFGYHW